MKTFVRIISFFAKELNAIRRQPILIAGLILGPFLILLLFGIGYTGERPTLRTALVVPPGSADDPQIEELKKRVGPTFVVTEVFEDEAPAMTLLKQGRIDVVEAFPPEVTSVYSTGQPVEIKITYNQIDPLLRDWIEYLSYAQINELNKGLLQSFVGDSQERIGTLRQYVAQGRTELSQVRQQLSSGNREQAIATIRRLRDSGVLQLVTLALVQDQDSDGANNQSAQTLSQIQTNLDTLEGELTAGGAVDQQAQRLDEIDTQLGDLDKVAEQVRTMDPTVIVSPLRSKTNNLAPVGNLGDPNVNPSQAYVRFYTPAVLALLLQHMMVTLAALSLVRERLLGTIEVFRVSPLTAFQVLIGKYLGYTLFSALILAALVPLMVLGLGIPFPLQQLGIFSAISLLLTIASLGWGFVISAVVNSDSQAVQFSMLMLLLAVFFSGFFIPLKSFIAFVGYIANLLPVTHGIRAFQQMLLLNQAPTYGPYLWLGGIALVSFLLAWFIFRRQFKRR